MALNPCSADLQPKSPAVGGIIHCLTFDRIATEPDQWLIGQQVEPIRGKRNTPT